MTNGKILNRLLYLAVPILGSQTLQMLYNLTDMFLLGRLGSKELAATGNSRTPFICNIVGMFLNMALDPIFIFSLRLGVLGVAYATIIGQIVAFTMFIAFIKTSKNVLLRI